jgi:hypothetical protein
VQADYMVKVRKMYQLGMSRQDAIARINGGIYGDYLSYLAPQINFVHDGYTDYLSDEQAHKGFYTYCMLFD